MNKFAVRITGETPLLMHRDNFVWADTLKKWSTDPANKKKSIAGDDRSPAWTWLGNLYHDNGLVVLPSDNLMTMLREGGNKVPTPGGIGKVKTFKALTQSGLVVDQVAWPIVVNGKTIPYDPLFELTKEQEFELHEMQAQESGFMLFVKRARIGQNKHIRVRPRFDEWSCQGTITVLEEMITREVLQNILDFAGVYAGLGDWRPSSPKSPGTFGKFTAEIKMI